MVGLQSIEGVGNEDHNGSDSGSDKGGGWKTIVGHRRQQRSGSVAFDRCDAAVIARTTTKSVQRLWSKRYLWPQIPGKPDSSSQGHLSGSVADIVMSPPAVAAWLAAACRGRTVGQKTPTTHCRRVKKTKQDRLKGATK